MVLNLTIKGVGGIADSAVVCRDDATVAQLKAEVAKATSIAADEQKIIYKGRVLENHMELAAVGIKDNHTVFLVRSRRSAAPSPAAAPRNNANSPFGNMFGGPNAGNSNIMQQLANSPHVRRMLENPDFIRNMMNANPQMRALMESNPQIAQQMQVGNKRKLMIFEHINLMVITESSSPC